MSWLDSCQGFAEVDAELGPLTTFRIGGRARLLFRPRTLEEVRRTVGALRERGVRWHVLGRGANLLVEDAGVEAVIHLAELAGVVAVDPGRCLLRVWAGTPLPAVVRLAAELGFEGLQGLAGVPGSVGGAVALNAGGRDGTAGQALERALLLTPEGELEWRSDRELGLGYRTAELRGGIVLQAEFRLRRGRREEIRRAAREILARKQASQPLSLRSAGCIFKNPPGLRAGRLIDESGLKGRCRGGAYVSPQHANFIINGGDARSRDVLDLIAEVRDVVERRTGVGLDLEVKVWPERRASACDPAARAAPRGAG